MFSKNLLLLTFLMNIFNSTFCVPEELIELIGGVLPSTEQYKTNISNISVKLWAGLCEVSFQYLRNTFTEYSNLYVNYTLFNEENEKYSPSFVSAQYLDNTERLTVLLHCPGRPSMMLDNVFPLDYKYSKEIAIVPVVNVPSPAVLNETINKVYVFKHTVQIAEHELDNPRLVPDILFNRQPPAIEETFIFDQTVPSNIENILPKWIGNEKNVLITIKLEEFIKLCVWIFGQEKFKSEFIVSSNSADYGEQTPSEIRHVYIEDNGINEFIMTDIHSCKGTYMKPQTPNTSIQIPDVQYALMETYTDDKVMVCKSISRTLKFPGGEFPIFRALELVKNVDKQYLKEAP